MFDKGHILLHRSMLTWEWYKNTNTKNVFLHCLLKANWKPCRFEGIDVPAGAFVTSTRNLAKDLNLTTQEIRTALNHLKKSGEINTHSNRHYTLIMLNNWASYQNESTNNQQTINKPSTNKQQSINKQSTTIEKDNKAIKKEYKKERTIVQEKTDDDDEPFDFNDGTWIDWGEINRKEAEEKEKAMNNG